MFIFFAIRCLQSNNVLVAATSIRRESNQEKRMNMLDLCYHAMMLNLAMILVHTLSRLGTLTIFIALTVCMKYALDIILSFNGEETKNFLMVSGMALQGTWNCVTGMKTTIIVTKVVT